MAKIREIQYDPFKRGDTPVFVFEFISPYEGFNWSGVVVDIAMTDILAPNDNTGAAMLRLNQALSVYVDNKASVSVQPTILESKALTPSATYKVEAQLKEGQTNVATPITGKVTVIQDYVI